MQHRHDEPLYQICLAIIKDAQVTFPQDHLYFERDKLRLERIFEDHGSRVFLLDFPALGKHLDKCLSNGAYSESRLAYGRLVSKTVRVPRLFKGLYMRVFDLNGMLRPDADHNAIYFLRQIYAFGKKLRVDCGDTATYATIAEFYSVDKELPNPSLDWNGNSWDCGSGSALHLRDHAHDSDEPRTDGSLPPGVDPTLIDICQRVYDVIAVTLGKFDPYAFKPKHGPGAVADLRRGESKYDFPNWNWRLETVFPYSDFGQPNWGLWECCDPLPDIDPASKLVCVPKTYKGPRLIAAEPTAHQWCQQIIWDYIGNACRQSWLGEFCHFRDQSFNQAAALHASTNGLSWTVDLSSASDRVSCWLVERAFRRNPSLLTALWSSRTTHVQQSLDKKSPKDYYLRKFSTMGSACTFPVETLLFLGVCLAAAIYTDGTTRVNSAEIRRQIGRIHVFGDDIIVPSETGAYVEQLLTHLYFKVNDAKTHRNGRFRESCGVEAYEGTNVTPAYYLKLPDAGAPEDVVSTVECSNNFFEKGCWHAADWIKSTVTTVKIAVVAYSSGVFGWKTYCKGIPMRKRWNKSLQRFEARVILPVMRVTKVPIERWSALLQYFTERPAPDTKWVSGVVQKARLKLKPRWVATYSIDEDSSTGWFA